jgi:hypothetical protein
MESLREIHASAPRIELVRVSEESSRWSDLDTALIIGKKAILTVDNLLGHVPFVKDLGFDKTLLTRVLDKLDKDEATALYSYQGINDRCG